MQIPSTNIFTRSRLVWLSPIILSILLLTGCNQEQTNINAKTKPPATAASSATPLTPAKSPYRVIDSGVWADGMAILHFAYINWLDNNRVIFKYSKGSGKKRRGRFNLSVWEIGKGVTPYTDYAKRVTVCVQGNYVSYNLIDQNGVIHRYGGKPGQEKLFAINYDNYDKDKTIYYRHDCRIYQDAALKRLMKDRRRHFIKLLRRQHGYLDYGNPNDSPQKQKSEPVLYYQTGKQKPIALLIPRLPVNSMQYSAFKNAYFLNIPFHGKWFKTHETAWWLFPDGKVSKVHITPGNWLKDGGSKMYFPTKKGLFIVSYGHKSGRDPGFAGGYLVNDDKAVKVINGHVSGTAVSPDGCKVAFAHYPYLDATLPTDPARITLKVINFCLEDPTHG